jgi:succinate dehydrogenase / fumarate reductase, iron-sulfur subunit
MSDVTLRVWRGDASGGSFVEYSLPAQEGEVVLDVVHRVQAGPAPDLACRWNCKAGKCGSCSAEVNGVPRLMCMTRMDTLPEGVPVTLTPMRAFPIIRDLVTDVSFNYEMARQVPAFEPEPPGADGTYRMMQVDVERGQEFRKCIECFMCQDVCHVIRDHEENKPRYAGPRFFIRYMELESHPLDTNDRRQLIQERMGLGMCNITKCCTEVCPEHIKITDNGIIPLKERVVDARYDPVAWLGRKILGRKVAPVPALAATPSPIHASPATGSPSGGSTDGSTGGSTGSPPGGTSGSTTPGGAAYSSPVPLPGRPAPPTVPGGTAPDGYWGPPADPQAVAAEPSGAGAADGASGAGAEAGEASGSGPAAGEVDPTQTGGA